MLRYDDYLTEGIVFTRPNQDILFTASSIVEDQDVGIKVEPTARGLQIVLQGAVSTGDFGIYSSAHETAVVIASGGAINAVRPVHMTGLDQSLTNTGTITGGETGVLINGLGSELVNGGAITAKIGVALQGSEDGRFLNGRTGEVSASEFGVIFGGAYSASENTLVNLGTIKSPGYAFQGSATIERVINRGVIGGDIFLGLGDDLFNGRRGETLGQVYGSGGNDTYIVDDAATPIAEQFNDGLDRVRSSVDYALFDNFETLILTGGEDISGRGNDEDNVIIGNSGDNQLYGYGGYNTLAGGRGDDWLFGGSQTDTFVFGTGDGHDAIKNFQDNVDYLDLQDWKGLADFDVLLSHTTEENGNLVISFRGDQLIIENLTRAQFDIGDFAS